MEEIACDSNGDLVRLSDEYKAIININDRDFVNVYVATKIVIKISVRLEALVILI